MTQTTNNPPADTIRFGALKGVIWKNAGKDGKSDRYTVNYLRIYRTDDAEWKETTSFSEVDNLKLAQLVGKVADRINDLKVADRQSDDQG